MTPPFSIDVFFEEALSRSLDEHDRRLWCAIREQASGGKRFRPRLLLSMYRALGGPDKQVASAVADAVELLHASFLIHDDLIDGDHVRRGRPNVSGAFSDAARSSGAPEQKGRAYGEAAAILAGDLALAGAMRGFALCGASGPALVRLLNLVDEVLHRSAAGELADVRVSFTGGELDDVLDIAAWKTAAYSFELPLQSAAILAEADDATIEGLGRAGRSTGIAFQLMDDLDGVFASAEETGKDPFSDLREGKFTGLLAIARGTAQWEDLARLVGKPDLTSEEAERARSLLIECGAREAVAVLAEEFRRTALHEAASLPPAAAVVVRETIGRVLPLQRQGVIVG